MAVYDLKVAIENLLTEFEEFSNTDATNNEIDLMDEIAGKLEELKTSIKNNSNE